MINALATDWTEALETPYSNELIKKSLRKLKISFHISLFISILMVFIGGWLIYGENDMTGKLIGLLIDIAGFVLACTSKIATGILIAKYQILWQMNKHFEGNIQNELHRSQAQDL
jgi:hypothetical protein